MSAVAVAGGIRARVLDGRSNALLRLPDEVGIVYNRGMLHQDDRDLLATEIATRFAIGDSGRILYENAPDRSAAPRLYLAGCEAGNQVRLRHDVGEGTARAIELLVTDEPFLCDWGSIPVHLVEYVRLLASEAPVERWDSGLIWVFLDRLACEHDPALLGSESPEGDRLLRRIRECGMPEALSALGFVGVNDFWSPWCAALRDDEIASIAFSARIGPAGAETGVVTVPAFRGRGYAAAATAGWASLPSLRSRALFYSTSRSNTSSQRVAQRLGLCFLGASLTIV